MPVHDWSRVISGIFHHFHHDWISEIAGRLNQGLLPSDFYALAEQHADGPIPDVLALERDVGSQPWTGGGSPDCGDAPGGVAVAERPPLVEYTLEAEQDLYAAKANHVAIFHASGDRVVAYIEIVSPGNKSSEHQTEKFLDKLTDAMSRGCHLLVIDLHRPSHRDPRGLHARFWEERFGQTDSPGVDELKPFGLMAYRSDISPTAYFQRVSLGEPLPEMPIFLTPDIYVNVPLESTYAEAWSHVPARWRNVVDPPA